MLEGELEGQLVKGGWRPECSSVLQESVKAGERHCRLIDGTVPILSVAVVNKGDLGWV